MPDYDEFRIRHRHMSESQWRDAYCRENGADPADLDQRTWEDRERRDAYYRKTDEGEGL